MRSTGRGKLPACVVTMRSMLCFMASLLMHCSHVAIGLQVDITPCLPELPGGETGPFCQSGKLEPGDTGMGIVKPHSGGGKPAISAGDNVLTPNQSGEPHDAFGDEFGVLDQVRGVTDDPWDEHFPLGQLHPLEDMVFVFVARVGCFK